MKILTKLDDIGTAVRVAVVQLTHRARPYILFVFCDSRKPFQKFKKLTLDGLMEDTIAMHYMYAHNVG